MDTKEKINREKANKNIIERMKRGESLAVVSLEATHFPPRPIIKKLFPQKKPTLVKDTPDDEAY